MNRTTDIIASGSTIVTQLNKTQTEGRLEHINRKQ